MLPSTLCRIILAAAAGLHFRPFADARPHGASPSSSSISSSSTPTTNSSSHLPSSANMSSPMTILMGSYSSPESAHVVYFTPPTTAEGTDGKLVVGPSHKLGQSASWFAQHPKHADVVYGVLEKEPEDGEIVQVRLGQDAKEAKVEGTRSTLGAAPAHCAVVADGKALAVANYAGGSVFLQPLEADGSFSSAPGNLIKFPFEPTTTPLRNENRQEASHPHEVVEVAIEGGKTEIWVPDLGQDKIWRLELEEKASVASWKLKEGTHVAGDDGGGPRHIVVGDKGKDLYVMNELLPNVVHVKVDGESGKTSFRSKTSVIAPPPAEPVTQNTFPSGSELLLLSSTKPHPTLVASTRTLFDRPTDALAFFSVLPSGELELQQFAYPKGREFRATGASKDGRFVVTGGQADGWVSVLGQDKDGLWRPVAEPVQVEKPTGVLFL